MSYKEAIDIISSEQDWKELCITIAKMDPSILCKAVSYEADLKAAKELRLVNSLSEEVKSIYGNGNGFIPAIKFYRNETGLCLKESKEAVEKIVGHNQRL